MIVTMNLMVMITDNDLVDNKYADEVGKSSMRKKQKTLTAMQIKQGTLTKYPSLESTLLSRFFV